MAWSILAFALAVLIAEDARANQGAQLKPPASSRVKVFLDCQECFADFLRQGVAFVDHVRDRTEADVHVLVTSADTGGGGQEYTVAFIGIGRFNGLNRTLKAVTVRSDTEDRLRRQLASAVALGLLDYVAKDGVPPGLALDVQVGGEENRTAGRVDRWNHWVFSLRGAAAFQGEESSRQTEVGGSLSADRITPDWKVSFGAEIDHETEEFDLDEETPVKVRRREREFEWLLVKGLGEHWSLGATGDIESSTFDNIKLAVAASPAIEYNVYPYSMYTRRQLRALYSLGVRRQEYYEPTLFDRLEETLPAHELSLTFEQREQWGTLESRVEWSQFLKGLDRTRLEVEGQLSVRLAKGFTVDANVNASRIRDQISLPARGATPEEILLRLRQLQSGYEYEVGLSVTYSFGSIFSSVVNPRFGQ
jgi:hypothetical protein